MNKLFLLFALTGTLAQAAGPWNRTCRNDNLSIETKSVGSFAKMIRIQKISAGSSSSPAGGFKDASWKGLVLIFDSTKCQVSSTFCNGAAKDFTLTVWNQKGETIQLPEIGGIQFALTYRAHGSFLALPGTTGLSGQFVFGEFRDEGDCKIN